MEFNTLFENSTYNENLNMNIKYESPSEGESDSEESYKSFDEENGINIETKKYFKYCLCL